jgi:acyl dehydratase
MRANDWGPGDLVLDQTLAGASRAAIALFSEATEDPNPIHVDEDFARRCGFPQVIQQGPMTTAHFARLLARHFGPARLKLLDVTFTAPVFPEEGLRLTARVAKVEGDIMLELAAAKADGTTTAKGIAVIAAERA